MTNHLTDYLLIAIFFMLMAIFCQIDVGHMAKGLPKSLVGLICMIAAIAVFIVGAVTS